MKYVIRFLLSLVQSFTACNFLTLSASLKCFSCWTDRTFLVQEKPTAKPQLQPEPLEVEVVFKHYQMNASRKYF